MSIQSIIIFICYEFRNSCSIDLLTRHCSSDFFEKSMTGEGYNHTAPFEKGELRSTKMKGHGQ